MLLACFTLFFGSIINANVFGQLSILVSEMAVRNKRFQRKIESVNSIIHALKLPAELSKSIRNNVICNQDGFDSGNEISWFFGHISPSLRSQVIEIDFYHIVWQQQCFQFDKRVLDLVLQEMELQLTHPGDVTIR